MSRAAALVVALREVMDREHMTPSEISDFTKLVLKSELLVTKRVFPRDNPGSPSPSAGATGAGSDAFMYATGDDPPSQNPNIKATDGREYAYVLPYLTSYQADVYGMTVAGGFTEQDYAIHLLAPSAKDGPILGHWEPGQSQALPGGGVTYAKPVPFVSAIYVDPTLTEKAYGTFAIPSAPTPNPGFPDPVVKAPQLSVNQAATFDWTGPQTFENDVVFNAPVEFNAGIAFVGTPEFETGFTVDHSSTGEFTSGSTLKVDTGGFAVINGGVSGSTASVNWPSASTTLHDLTLTPAGLGFAALSVNGITSLNGNTGFGAGTTIDLGSAGTTVQTHGATFAGGPTFTGLVNFSNAVDFNGNTNFAGGTTLDLGSSLTTVATHGATFTGGPNFSGDCDFANNVAVTGNETVGGTLGVTGLSTLGRLLVTADAVVGTTLGVSGLSTLARASVTADLAVGTTLGVSGLSTLAGVSAGSTTLHDLTVTPGTTSLHDGSVANNFAVNGVTSLNGNVGLAGGIVFDFGSSGTAVQTHGATFSGGPSFTGTCDFQNDVHVDGSLTLTGGFSNLAVGGNLAIGGYVGFYGQTAVPQQGVTGALSSVTDANAKAVLRSIINALGLVGDGSAAHGHALIVDSTT